MICQKDNGENYILSVFKTLMSIDLHLASPADPKTFWQVIIWNVNWRSSNQKKQEAASVIMSIYLTRLVLALSSWNLAWKDLVCCVEKGDLTLPGGLSQ